MLPGRGPQGGSGEILKEGNMNRAKRRARLSQAGERKEEAFQTSGEAGEVQMFSTSSLDKHTEQVTGSEQRVKSRRPVAVRSLWGRP